MSTVDDKAAPPAFRRMGPFTVEDGKVRLLGVEVGDWGALLALIVSIGTFAWTVTDKLLLRPIPQIIAPQTIEFFCSNYTTTDAGSRCDADENLNIRASPVSIINRAAEPHSYVLQSIAADVVFLDNHGSSKKNIELAWLYFSEISTSDAKRSPAVPILLGGGAAVAKEIEFYPRLVIDDGPKGGVPVANRKNFLKFSDFETLIGTGDIHEIKLTFNAISLDSNVSSSSTCVVPIDDQFVKNANSVFALFVRDCSVKPSK